MTITATDGDGGETSVDFDLTVENQVPGVEVEDAVTTITEGLDGSNQISVSDVAFIESIVIEASIGEVTNNGDGTAFLLIDDTDGTLESQLVTVTATDIFGGTGQTEFNLVVENLAPGLAVDLPSVTLLEGTVAENTGSVSDPGNDAVSLSASVGSVTDNEDGTWSWTHAPTESQVVTITATDGEGASSEVTFELIVDQYLPTINADSQAVQVAVGGDATNTGTWGLEGDPAPVTLSVSIGEITQNPEGTWDWSMDEVAESTTVTVTAVSESGTSEATFDVVAQVATVSVVGDTATIVGTGDDDVFEVHMGETMHTVIGAGTEHTFDASVVTTINVGSGGGVDSITVVGTSADDSGIVIDGTGTLASENYIVQTFGFVSTTMDGNGGNDSSQLFGSDVADAYSGFKLDVTLTTPDYDSRMLDFDRVDAFGRGGDDYAVLYGSNDSDFLHANKEFSYMENSDYKNVVKGFERVDAFGRGGIDYTQILDSADDDTLFVFDTHSVLSSVDRTTSIKGFEVATVTASTGSDEAILYASGDLNHEFISFLGMAILSNEASTSTVVGFSSVSAVSEGTGTNIGRINEVLSVDTLFASADVAAMESRNLLISGFDEVIAEALDDESPTANVEDIDYTLSTIGDWII